MNNRNQPRKKFSSKKNKGSENLNSFKSFAAKEKKLELSLVRTYPKQVVWQTWLPGTPSKQTTTVTTGVRQSSFPVANTSMAAFATRFASTFVEYRIIKARFIYRCFSSTIPGISQIWIDEKSTASPTLDEARERAVLSISHANVVKTHELLWTCSDPLDLQYTIISSAVTVASFKLYTDAAIFGAPTVATEFMEIVPYFYVQFRGLQGPA